MACTVDENYQSKARKPDDFDAFWDDVRAQVARVELNPRVEPEPARSDDEVEVFQAFYDSIDNVRVAAWYCVPRGERGPLPAIMIVPETYLKITTYNHYCPVERFEKACK